jgi:hypothetical protein
MRRLGMITTVVVLASFAVVVAKSSYKTTFNNLYGTAGKTLDTCDTCHMNGFDWNPYGDDIKTELNKGSSITAALQAIEGTDSDLDSYSNIVEINAGTFPGNPDSTLPVEASTWGKIKALFD